MLRNAADCSQCGTAPEMRREDDRGLFMPACPKCKHHASPYPSESGAIALWNRANAPQRPCLGCGGKPRLRNSRLRGLWAFQCRGCGHSTTGSHTVMGAVTAWHRHNTPGNGHYWMLWQQRHQELQAQHQG
ncbi:hypothetical protein [Marinobacterium jannaschii]|uniref:hypothetical protein n=1 Tax=Marinobacterium jannaschii TaxID=64970 RepID=UPI0004826F0A|nr:hypothetical protein [Marinobacterium jannaschii]